MRITILTAAVVAATFISGCTTPEQRAQQIVAGVPEASRAYIIGTYAIECRPAKDACTQAFNVMPVHYRSVDNKNVDTTIEFMWGNMFGGDTVADYTWPDRSEKGMFFCVALPPGRYQFYGYDFWNFAGGGSGYRFRKDNEFDLPFTLAPGEVVNLGKLKLTTSIGKNIFGMKLMAPGLLMVSAAPALDTAAALQKCPAGVRDRKPRDGTLRAAQAHSPFVIEAP